jgi:hypothetical protein
MNVTAPEIQSVGLPHFLHADRVVAEMLRDLAKKRAQIEMAVGAAIDNSKDGNPRAQTKMAERMRRAGAEHVSLTPGKRGKYTLQIWQWIGWDPIRDQEIRIDTPIPEKPWLAFHVLHVETRGRGRGLADIAEGPITHHALSRAAQRFGMRTNDHMLAAARRILHATADLIHDNARDWTPPPPQGLRIPLDTADNAIVVLKQHASRERTLVAATVFSNGDA